MLPHLLSFVLRKTWVGALLACLLSWPAVGQSGAANDGFLRQNGTTYVVRHGQLRPLSREVHLPNGRTVTPEGFVIEPDGKRQPLAEGQACDLQGTLRSARRQPNGTWAVVGGRSAPRGSQTVSLDDEGRWVPPGVRKKWQKRRGKRKKHDD
ncbi:DUF6799 domain-containing protein [Solirubrum puertoriconensis]|uniref:DUF6799 domain-containing protein n=1 Tax=Solirubrum puertoriconensis TaxID=1751427 RepID=A0A9X0HL84_SOLP1|nr:DUF6799 domain-containing protein [Solirubrum puertoriconensis]KUG08003.1 hypothetical protein ASU33_07280 [Solirubrum puertoriconensis]